MTEPVVNDAPLECGCTDAGPVCAHHRRLAEYAQAVRGTAGTPSDLPDLLLRPTFSTWWGQLGTFRMIVVVAVLAVVPVFTAFMASDVRVGLAFFALFAGPLLVLMPLMLSQRLSIDPRARVVRFRNWYGRTVVMAVDDSMRGSAFQYVSAAGIQVNVIVSTPTGHARLHQQQWGFTQLEDLVLVLGVPIGGVYGDAEIAEMFPDVVPSINKHPMAWALGIVAVVVALVLGTFGAVAYFSDDDSSSSDDREPSVTERNGPKPSAMPADVVARQDTLDASLTNVLAGDAEWTTTSSVRPCDEQPGWQREVEHRIDDGGRRADDALVSSFTRTVEEAGLRLDRNEKLSGSIALSTEYGSTTGAGVRAYIDDPPEGDDRIGVSLTSDSACVVTR